MGDNHDAEKQLKIQIARDLRDSRQFTKMALAKQQAERTVERERKKREDKSQ